MSVSGTTDFNLDFGEAIEEAYEIAGMELKTGNDIRSARRSANLLLLEWASEEGIDIWKVEEILWDSDGDGGGTTTLTSGTSSYTIRTDTIDIIDMCIRIGSGTTQEDYFINKCAYAEFNRITNKNTQGRPTQYKFNRVDIKDYSSSDKASTVTLWPVPDKSNYYSLIYWRVKRMDDVTGANIDSTFDFPDRFLSAFIYGLAHKIGSKAKDPVILEKVPFIYEQYQDKLSKAKDNNREKATMRIVPRIYPIV